MKYGDLVRCTIAGLERWLWMYVIQFRNDEKTVAVMPLDTTVWRIHDVYYFSPKSLEVVDDASP